MPWFNVDDGFYDHPKVNTVSNASVGLWTKAGSWCAKHLTDGFIPVAQVKRLGGTERQLRPLVDSGMWIVHLNAGGKVEKYEMAGYLDANRSRNRVEADRKENKERQAKHRAKKGSTSGNANLSQRDNGVSHSAQSNPIQSNPKKRGEQQPQSLSGTQSTTESPPQEIPKGKTEYGIPEEWIINPHPHGYQRCMERHKSGNVNNVACRSCGETEKRIEGIRAERRKERVSMKRDREATRSRGKDACTVCDNGGYRLGLNVNTGISRNVKCDHTENDRMDQEAATEADRNRSGASRPKGRHLHVA